jgi:hypothetical protein
MRGFVAQLVEQRTENPCVGSSILPEATRIPPKSPCPATPKKNTILNRERL